MSHNWYFYNNTDKSTTFCTSITTTTAAPWSPSISDCIVKTNASADKGIQNVDVCTAAEKSRGRWNKPTKKMWLWVEFNFTEHKARHYWFFSRTASAAPEPQAMEYGVARNYGKSNHKQQLRSLPLSPLPWIKGSFCHIVNVLMHLKATLKRNFIAF